MKRLIFGAACAGILALCQTAHANLLEISLDPETHAPSDVPFNTITGNPVSVRAWLDGEILSWNNLGNSPTLPPTTTSQLRYDNLGGNGITIQVGAGDYIVEHYGVGPNGTPGTGGGLVAYYATSAESYTVPDNGPGPNGTGGISFVDVWDPPGRTVPEGGQTLVMLGAGLASVVAFARSKKST